MCTVTFFPNRRGYRLGMNRDENRARVAALPPRLVRQAGRRVAGPSEPGGGTWISLNDAGATLALVNWYSVESPAAAGGVSRGEVVRSVRVAATVEEGDLCLNGLTLEKVRPFRLIGIFPAARRVAEWRWDRETLTRADHPWGPAQWISSGHDEPGAQRARGGVFQHHLGQADAGRRAWLRRLHGSHLPESGPYSTCMHRPESVTVSYTEVVVGAAGSVIRYHDRALCEPGLWAALRLNTDDCPA